MDIHFSLMGIYGKLYPFKSRNLSDRSLITDPQQIMIGRRCGLVVKLLDSHFIGAGGSYDHGSNTAGISCFFPSLSSIFLSMCYTNN